MIEKLKTSLSLWPLSREAVVALCSTNCYESVSPRSILRIMIQRAFQRWNSRPIWCSSAVSRSMGLRNYPSRKCSTTTGSDRPWPPPPPTGPSFKRESAGLFLSSIFIGHATALSLGVSFQEDFTGRLFGNLHCPRIWPLPTSGNGFGGLPGVGFAGLSVSAAVCEASGIEVGMHFRRTLAPNVS